MTLRTNVRYTRACTFRRARLPRVAGWGVTFRPGEVQAPRRGLQPARPRGRALPGRPLLRGGLLLLLARDGRDLADEREADLQSTESTELEYQKVSQMHSMHWHIEFWTSDIEKLLYGIS